MAAGIPVWFIRDLKRDVVTIRDNHLVHLARSVESMKDDVSDIKEILGRHDERLSTLEKK